MLKGIPTLLGVGLIFLWGAGLGSPTATGWLTWLAGLGALWAFYIGSMSSATKSTLGSAVSSPINSTNSANENDEITDYSTQIEDTKNYSIKSPMGGSFGLSMVLFVLWIMGLATHVTSWLAWWTFGFACAFLGLGFAYMANQKAAPQARGKPLIREKTELERERDEDRIRSA